MTLGIILWDKCFGGQLLSHRVIRYLCFQETTELLSKVAARVTFPQQRPSEPVSPLPPSFALSRFFTVNRTLIFSF